MQTRHGFGWCQEVKGYSESLIRAGGADLSNGNFGSKLSQFFDRLDAALATGGRLSGFSALVDAAFFPKGCNMDFGTSFLTFRGRTGTLVNGPTFGAGGLLLNKTVAAQTQYATVTLPSTLAGTVVFVGAMGGGGGTVIDSVNTVQAVFFLGNSAGVDNIACALGAQLTSGVGSTPAGAAQGYVKQNPSAESGTSAMVASATVHGFLACDAIAHTLAITNDNAASPTVVGYVDGLQNVTKTGTGLIQVTNSCTVLDIAAKNQTGVRGQFSTMTCAAILVFNRVLTAAEVAAVDRACQWLMPENNILVVDGDSDSFLNGGGPASNPSTQKEWPYVAWQLLGGQNGRYRLLNSAFTGTQVANLVTGYPTLVRPFRSSNRFNKGIYAPFIGINDITVGGATAASLLSAINALLATAKADGFTTVGFTLPFMPIYTTAFNTIRLAFNASVRANGLTNADFICDVDTAVPASIGGSFVFDQNHLNDAGYALIANAFAKLPIF